MKNLKGLSENQIDETKLNHAFKLFQTGLYTKSIICKHCQITIYQFNKYLKIRALEAEQQQHKLFNDEITN